MGFFSNLFGTPQPTTLEQRMVAEYTTAFAATGMGVAEARKLAEEMVVEAQQIVNSTALGWAI